MWAEVKETNWEFSRQSQIVKSIKKERKLKETAQRLFQFDLFEWEANDWWRLPIPHCIKFTTAIINNFNSKLSRCFRQQGLIKASCSTRLHRQSDKQSVSIKIGAHCHLKLIIGSPRTTWRPQTSNSAVSTDYLPWLLTALQQIAPRLSVVDAILIAYCRPKPQVKYRKITVRQML